MGTKDGWEVCLSPVAAGVNDVPVTTAYCHKLLLISVSCTLQDKNVHSPIVPIYAVDAQQPSPLVVRTGSGTIRMLVDRHHLQ